MKVAIAIKSIFHNLFLLIFITNPNPNKPNPNLIKYFGDDLNQVLFQINTSPNIVTGSDKASGKSWKIGRSGYLRASFVSMVLFSPM